jgi:hypothetical protein
MAKVIFRYLELMVMPFFLTETGLQSSSQKVQESSALLGCLLGERRDR